MTPSVPFVFTQDGRLAAGDQLLSVDGRSLVGLSQERYSHPICAFIVIKKLFNLSLLAALL